MLILLKVNGINKKRTSQQITRQYLGPLAQININKIPEEYYVLQKENFLA